MSAIEALEERLRQHTACWVVTGAAGFIGSHLVEKLLQLGQQVVGADNFATGYRSNLDDVQQRVGAEQWRQFRFVEGDVCDPEVCREITRGADYVLHQAALGSVPRSIADPLQTNRANVTGFLNILVAARDAGVRRFVYAASSSTYGDHPDLPKVEDRIGKPLSPYAVTKYVNELYAQVFYTSYGIETVGLRYFNVFGPRQDARGAYAAVIPRWIEALLQGESPQINGDGSTSRDFCYIGNAVQANLLAATCSLASDAPRVFNVAVGDRTSLNELFSQMRTQLATYSPAIAGIEPQYREFRAGDVRHSQADISRAREFLGYSPTHDVAVGLAETCAWFAGVHAGKEVA